MIERARNKPALNKGETMKHIFDLAHVKSVKAWALLFNGEHAGRVIANFSDNPNGSVCTCAVHIWDKYEKQIGLTPLDAGKPNEDYIAPQGQAGGYGYCKFSSAFADALRRKYGIENEQIAGRGESAMIQWLNGKGLQVIEVL